MRIGKWKINADVKLLGFLITVLLLWQSTSTDVNAAGVKPADSVVSDIANYLTVPKENVIVFYEKGRFAGWPANNGVWSWGNEILVGFHLSYYKESSSGHSRDRDRGQVKMLARSLDGGQTWSIEDPSNYIDDAPTRTPCPGNINFAHPGFAMHVDDVKFVYSYDRGKTWKGMFLFNDMGVGELTSRTDYIVNGPGDCLLFTSSKQDGVVESNYQDRALCARTTDGGKTFVLQGWMTHDLKVRSVMPATVRLSDTDLVSAMRRKHSTRIKGGPKITKNWIDTSVSNDNGKTWKFLSKVAVTDRGDNNGNPPSMVKLKDGRLCVAYCYRASPIGLRAKISSDNGRTWGKEIMLRKDGRTWDLGYSRMVVRPDGKVVTIYYYTTEKNKEQHIAATIWDPTSVK